MTIRADIQKLDPGALVELFILDLTSLGLGLMYFHPGTDLGMNKIVFQGNTYEPFPVEATGFEYSGAGQSPRPKVRAANVNQILGTLNRDYQDLVGAKILRKRTFAKYLDGEVGADPTAEFPIDVYYIERKVAENKIFVEYELVGVWDMDGVFLPRRQIVGSVCWWRYLSGECSWLGGPPYYTVNDVLTVNASEDSCGKKLSSCSVRFGADAELPFGGFPGAGRIG